MTPQTRNRTRERQIIMIRHTVFYRQIGRDTSYILEKIIYLPRCPETPPKKCTVRPLLIDWL